MALESYKNGEYGTIVEQLDDLHYVPGKIDIVTDIVEDALTNPSAEKTKLVTDLIKDGHPIQPIIRTFFIRYLLAKNRPAISSFVRHRLVSHSDLNDILHTFEQFPDSYTPDQSSDSIALIHWLQLM